MDKLLLFFIIVLIVLVVILIVGITSIITTSNKCAELCESKGMMKDGVANEYCYCKEVPENTFKLGESE